MGDRHQPEWLIAMAGIRIRTKKSHPVVFMTGLRDVPTTIQALKSGAVDFLLKPFADDVLLAAISRAVEQSRVHAAVRESVKEARDRLAALTPREDEVCRLVVDGMTSREIAPRLGIAESTVSIHRAHIMAKLHASSVAEVVRLVDLAKTDDAQEAFGQTSVPDPLP